MIKTYKSYIKENINRELDPYDEEIWDDNLFFIGNILCSKEKIKKGDFIIDLEKIGIKINEIELGVLRCVDILDDNDLVWETLDSKSSACDSINQFIKVVRF